VEGGRGVVRGGKIGEKWEGGEGGAWGGERKEGRGMGGINLPHSRLKILAALVSNRWL